MEKDTTIQDKKNAHTEQSESSLFPFHSSLTV